MKHLLVGGLVVVALAMFTVGCKESAELLAEKGTKAAKDTTKGLSDGVDKGRHSGESADSALLVVSADELRGNGFISVYAAHPGTSAGTMAMGQSSPTVELAVENSGDRPLRVSNLDFKGFDKEGFVVRRISVSPSESLTVPPHAKEKVEITFEKFPAKVRYWTVDLPVTATPAH